MVKLIHVDDDKGWRNLFKFQAESLGLDLHQFSSKEEAIAAIKKLSTENALTAEDIYMGDLHLDGDNMDNRDGYEIARTALEVGMQNVFIASDSATPSEVIPGAKLVGKSEARSQLLPSLVKGERGA